MIMDDREWHLSKSISLGHIVTTVTVLMGALWYFSATDNRISLVERDQRYIQENVGRLEKQQREQGQDLARQIDVLRAETSANFLNIDQKLDKIIDRELER